MDGTTYREFFTQPSQTYHRRYEALRTVFVDGQSQKKVAEQFGFTYGTMRQLVLEFRQACDSQDCPTDSPFFETPTADLQSSRMTKRIPTQQWQIGGN
jgi:hypothetical protein